MDARLQRRVQRYGWDRAADCYDASWGPQLRTVQQALLQDVALRAGEHVLDVACGTGLVTRDAAHAVGPSGAVLGVDVAEAMVRAARQAAAPLANTRFARMDAEALDLPPATFDAALCCLGLMYCPEPVAALRAMHRVLKRGGRLAVAVWGRRAACGWAPVLSIVDDEVRSDVCPLFFALGEGERLRAACADAGFVVTSSRRLQATLAYDSLDAACDAALLGGPVALAWSRFDEAARQRVRARYADAIAGSRDGTGYRLGAEFVVVTATAAAS